MRLLFKYQISGLVLGNVSSHRLVSCCVESCFCLVLLETYLVRGACPAQAHSEMESSEIQNGFLIIWF